MRFFAVGQLIEDLELHGLNVVDGSARVASE